MLIESSRHKWLYYICKGLGDSLSWIDEVFKIEESGFENPKSLRYRFIWPISCFLHDNIILELENFYYVLNGEFMNFDEGRPFTLSEYVRLFFIRRPIICIKDFIMYKVLWFERVDPHIGCPSYPCCDESPMGCIIERGIDDVEWYGWRD